MRLETDKERLMSFMRELSRRVQSPGTVYFTGGACAVWFGWRPMTIDIDLKADPEPAGFFEGIAGLKESLQVNIELASPDLFIPELPGWRDRSLFIEKVGEVDFFHYDFYAQALSKLERSHARDLVDLHSMRVEKLIEPSMLREFFLQIEPELIRFPAIEVASFRNTVMDYCDPAASI